MIDELSNVRGSSPFDDPTRMGGVAETPPPEKPTHPLDTHEKRSLFNRLMEWHEQEWQRQAANRYQMALDADYYDAMQWSEDDAKILMERGQAPLVFNEIKPTIDWILGTERRTRIDYKVLPRRKDGGDDAEAKTKLLKYLSDVNKSPYQRSRAFADAVKSGLGWLEVGLRGDPTEEMLFTRAENWRNMLYDSQAVEPDLSDARYVFRRKWLDEDIALAYFPDRADVIKKSVTDGFAFAGSDEEDVWYMGARVTQPGHDYQASSGKYRPYDGSAFAWSSRSRVKMIEAWYTLPVLKRCFNGGDYEGEVFDPNNQEHINALQGGFSLYDKLEMQIRCAIFTKAGLVFDGPSPYRHRRFPFVPVWAYRRKRDNAPYGVIRNLRDPQDDLNKRASKAQWILSTNRVIGEKGAVDDWDELREEVSRPDSIIVKNPGKELLIDRDVQLAQEHLQLMERNVQHIRNVGGVTAENLGRQTNADSGIAIQARQEQGTVVTTEVFDNLRFSTQLAGELELSNVEQFYTEPKVVRITGQRGGSQFVELNQPDPSTGRILNDITAFQADFVVSEQDYRSSLRQAMFESLFDITARLAQMNPQVAMNLLDLVVEMADLPNRDELVARIRKLNGQRDPDAEQTPEDQQAEAAAMQLQQAQQQLAMEQMRAQLAELTAKREKLDSETVQKRVEAMYAALQGAQVVATNPGIAPVADQIMRGSGFADKSAEADAKLIGQAQVAQPIPQMENKLDAITPSALQGVTRGIQTPDNDGVMQWENS